jgi:hypothetical protein
MKNFSDKICRENQKTRFGKTIFLNRAVYETTWKNFAEPSRP